MLSSVRMILVFVTTSKVLATGPIFVPEACDRIHAIMGDVPSLVVVQEYVFADVHGYHFTEETIV
jgi:hypothetical protein